MQHMNASVTWLELVQKGDSVRSIATKAGVDNSTLSRQIKAGEIRADMVIRIARGLGIDIIDALVASGYVQAEEAGVTRPTSTLRLATDQQLADEILRRLESVHDDVLDRPLAVEPSSDNVHALTPKNQTPELDPDGMPPWSDDMEILAARRVPDHMTSMRPKIKYADEFPDEDGPEDGA